MIGHRLAQAQELAVRQGPLGGIDVCPVYPELQAVDAIDMIDAGAATFGYVSAPPRSPATGASRRHCCGVPVQKSRPFDSTTSLCNAAM
jgi:hypothetical protein